VPRTELRLRAAVAALLIAFAACADDATGPDPEIRIETIEQSDLPALDPARTYESTLQGEDPETRLRDLLARGIPVARAWLPLDYLCLDPIGPRLTVELSRADAAILQFDFRQGTGRLACATALQQFVVLFPP
jgi:hypothetical protein